jgi:hypothetical protein
MSEVSMIPYKQTLFAYFSKERVFTLYKFINIADRASYLKLPFFSIV